MAYRFYIVPKVGVGTRTDPCRAAYVTNADGTSASGVGHTSGLDYGVEPCFLVAANVTPAAHTSITSHAEVLAVPATLTNTIGANRATVVAALETYNIPGEWVTAGMTWKAMLQWLTRLFAFAQRYNGMHGSAEFIGAQANLDRTLDTIGAAVRQRYADVAQSFGYNPALLTGSMTIRQAFAAVLPSVPTGNIADLLS